MNGQSNWTEAGERHARDRGWAVKCGALLALGTVVGLLYLGWRWSLPAPDDSLLPAPQEDVPPTASLESGAFLRSLTEAFQWVSQRVGPGVVHIDAQRVVGSTVPGDELRQLFGTRSPQELPSQGSGVVVDAEGYIVTNHHVIQGAARIDVVFGDGRKMRAELVGSDALTDLAVLRVAAKDLPYLEWGDSDRLQVGAVVWAVGSPFGLSQSVTFGIVSATNRNVGVGAGTFHEFLQTDAAINPGNSGGPLVDGAGLIVGINTAIIGQEYRGISFAIPSRIAREVYERLRAEGRVERGWIGVQLVEVEGGDAAEPEGVRVRTVPQNDAAPSPAQRAGIRGGDLIVRFDGQPVSTATQLQRMVAQAEIGREVAAELVRDGQRLTVRLLIAEAP